jgi:hypothetical protein
MTFRFYVIFTLDINDKYQTTNNIIRCLATNRENTISKIQTVFHRID